MGSLRWFGVCARGALALLAMASTARAEEPEPAGPRKVAVSEFAGERGKELRLALLEVLSEQDDLEVLGYRDIEVVAKRLGVGLSSASDRRKVAVELKIFAWFDADVADDGATIRLTGGKGRQLGTMELAAAGTEAQAGEIREGAWAALGHHVSDRALRVHVLGRHRAAAAKKLEARQQELANQRQLALEREQRRTARLADLRVEAQRKLADHEEEGARQIELAQERIAEENKKREQELVAQRKREAERQRALAMERQRAAQVSTMAKPNGPKPMPAPAPMAGAAAPPPSGRFGDRSWMDDASPATRQWLENRDAAPAPATAPAAPAAAPPSAGGGECPPTVSEATCKWLQSRGGPR